MGDYKYIRQYCEEDNDLRIRGGEIDSAKVFEALFGREPEPDEDQNMASALIDARRCFSPWHEDLLRAEFGQDTILVEEFRKQSKSGQMFDESKSDLELKQNLDGGLTVIRAMFTKIHSL